jgi:hypothetical protein
MASAPHLIEAPDWAADLFPDRPLMFARMRTPWLAYEHLNMPLRVLCSACVESDGKRWIHVSCSRPNRLPSWEELRLVKDTFIGRDRKAIQVLPPASEYVNDNPHVLHLWACLDGDGLPDFRKDGTI